jgi:hypothetical protein
MLTKGFLKVIFNYPSVPYKKRAAFWAAHTLVKSSRQKLNDLHVYVY